MRDLPFSRDLTTLAGWPDSWGPAPRFATARSSECPSFGPVVRRAAEALGHPLFPGQQFVFDVALEVAGGGPEPEWVFDEVVDTEPRRAGKTYKLLPLVAHRCSLPGRRQEVWLTAQDNTRAVDRWADVAVPLEAGLNRRRRVVKRLVSIGHETLSWLDGGSFFRPFAPGEKQLHGADPDLAIADELWSMDLEDKAHLETAIEPAFAVKAGQFWKLSAAGTERSSWLNLERERGRRAVLDGRRSGLAYFEWSVPEEVDGVPVDELEDDELVALVMRFHPRAGRGLREQYLWSQLAKGRPGFLRNFGNVTQEDRKIGLFPAEKWSLATWRLEQGKRVPDGARVAVGIGVDELGREASIVLGAKNGPVVIEAPKGLTRPGETWLPAEVVRLWSLYEVAVIAGNYAGRARGAIDKVAELLPEAVMLKLTGQDYAAACGRLRSEIVEATPERPSMIQHGNEPHLTAAMQAAVESNRLKAGPVWAMGETREPIEVLEAATVCVWGVDHMPAAAEPEPVPFRIF